MLGFIGFSIGVSVYVLESLAFEQRDWPDATYYQRQPYLRPSPYHRRWLIPLLCGKSQWRWQLVNALSIGALGALAAVRAGDWRAAVLLCLLAGVSWVPAACPKLVDAPAMALALGAAYAWETGHAGTAFLCALVSGCCKESGPVFAACYSANPIFLLFLLPIEWAGGAPVRTSDDPRLPEAWIGRSYPELFRFVRKYKPSDWRGDLLSWGSLPVLAFLGGGSLPLALSLTVAFGTTLIACDRVRLWHWAAPAVVACAMRAPDPWLTIGCAVQLLAKRGV